MRNGNGLTPTDLDIPVFFMFITGISTYISLKKDTCRRHEDSEKYTILIFLIAWVSAGSRGSVIWTSPTEGHWFSAPRSRTDIRCIRIRRHAASGPLLRRDRYHCADHEAPQNFPYLIATHGGHPHLLVRGNGFAYNDPFCCRPCHPCPRTCTTYALTRRP